MPAEKSGAHIGAIHNWIQWNTFNGDRVDWGSDEPLILKRNVTARFLEEITQIVADAVIDDPHLVTADKLSDRWKDKNYPPFKLEVDNSTVMLEMNGHVHEYLNLNDALSLLFYLLSKPV